MLDRYNKALEEFDKAIELNPNDPDYYYNKGCSQYSDKIIYF